jgi:hypothetical protein
MLLAVTIVASLASLMLGMYTLRFNAAQKVNQYFAAFCFVITAWLFCNYASLHTYNLYVTRLLMALAALMVLLLLLFTYHFAYERIEKRVLYFVYVIGAAAVLVGASPLLFEAIVVDNEFAYPIIGVGMYFFAPFSVISTLWSFALLLRVIWTEPVRTMRRVQAEWMSFGLIATMSIMILFGFVVVNIWHTTRFIPIAMASTLIFLGSTAYAMTRYRFLDVRIILKKSLVYGGALALFALAYTLLVLGGYFQLQEVSYIHPALWLMAAVLVFIVLFEAVRVRFKNLLDGWFFRENIEFAKIIDESQHELNSTHELESYVLRLVGTVQEVANAPVHEVLIRQRQYKRFKSFFPPRSKSYLLFSDDAVQELESKKLRGVGLLSVLREKQSGFALQKVLQKYHTEAYMTVEGEDDEVIAIVLMGPHKSKHVLTMESLQKLEAVRADAHQMLPAYLQLQMAIEGAKVMILER